MAKGYLLLGHEVSKEIYEKYSYAKFIFMGRPVSLDGIHLWATEPEIEEQFPQYAAEAKAIIAGIEKEITEAAKPRQAQTFHSFLEELNALYKEESGKYFKALEAFEIARKEYEATMADHKAPDYMKTIAKGELERARETLKQAKRESGDSYKARAAEIREKLQTFTDDLYRATPDRIDQGAMQLLNTGIMSADEMEHLANQFRNNPPMMRIIGQYARTKAESFAANAQDHAMPYRVLASKLKSVGDTSNAFAGFDSLMDFGQQGLGNDETMAKVRSHHWNRMYNGTVESYNDFIVQAGNTEG